MLLNYSFLPYSIPASISALLMPSLLACLPHCLLRSTHEIVAVAPWFGMRSWPEPRGRQEPSDSDILDFVCHLSDLEYSKLFEDS
jgi:hypothetical protein